MWDGSTPPDCIAWTFISRLQLPLMDYQPSLVSLVFSMDGFEPCLRRGIDAPEQQSRILSVNKTQPRADM